MVKNNYYSFFSSVRAFFILLFIVATQLVWGQTTLVNPTGDGGFENGTTFADNGWTVVSSVQSWNLGTSSITATTAGTKMAFTSTTSSSWTAPTSASVTHIYKDITIPSGETKLSITFKYKTLAVDATFDFIKVHLVSTSVTPVAGTELAIGQIGSNTDGTTAYATYTFNTVAASGAQRLVISFKNDNASPYGAAAIDEVSVVSSVPSNISSAVTSGLWSAASTWTGGVVPSNGDNITIVDGSTVSLDMSPTIGSLTIGSGSGAAAILQDNTGTTAYTLTVASDVTINDNGTLRSNTTSPASSTSHSISIAGNLTINGAGVFNGAASTNSKLNLTFTGTANATFTTSSSSTVSFNTVTINKGSSSAPILEFTPGASWTATAGSQGFVITNGTLKLSGTTTISSTLFNSVAYTIPSTGGFWLNNANFTVTGQNGSPTNSGVLRITNGTFNIGTATGNSMSGTTGQYNFEGGTINVASKITCSGAGSFTMSGGVLNITTVGNSTSSSGGLDFSSTSSSANISGGTINLVQTNTGTTPLDFRIASTSVSITGGVLNVGTSATATNFTFRLSGALPALVVSNSTNNKTASLFASSVAYSTITVNSGATLNCNGFILSVYGNTTNDGAIVGSTTSSRFYFSGTSSQSYSGSGTFGTVASPFDGIGINNTSGSGTTLNSPIITLRANLFSGTFYNSNQITLGNGGSTSSYVQIGQSSGTVVAGSFDVAPVFNTGTGGHNLYYLQESASRTTGLEIPSSRVVASVQISNTNGVLLSGGNLSIGGGSAPTLTMSAGNLDLGGNTLTLGASASSSTLSGVLSYTGGFIQNGTFTRWFPTSSLPTSIANGNAGHFPVASSGNNRSVWLFFSSATALSTGGTISVTHNNATGLSSITGFSDGGVVVDTKTNANWIISQSGCVLSASATVATRIQCSGLSSLGTLGVGTLANLRMIRSSDAVATSSNGTNTTADPQVNRTTLSLADLANTFYVGAPSADLYTMISWIGGSGNWGDATNWSSNPVIPTSADNIQIAPASNSTITVDNNYSIKSLLIGTNANIVLGSNTLTLNGAYTQNAGSIDLGSGGLDIKGSSFVKSGGTFTANTSTTTFSGTTQSIANGVSFYNLSLSGGTKTFTTGQTYSVANNLVVAADALVALSAATSTSISVGNSLSYSATSGGTNIGNLTLNLTSTSGTATIYSSSTGLVTPNVTIAAGGIQTLLSNFEISSGRILLLNGTASRLNTAGFVVSGAGGFTMGNSSILGVGNSSGGFGSAITVSGTKTYPTTTTISAYVDYNYSGAQTIDVSNHPVSLGIWTSGSGTKTLSGNITLTANSVASSGANPVLKVLAGSTFSDGGYVVSLGNADAGYQNIEVNGLYSSSGSGGLTYLSASNLSGSAISFVNGTTFGNININTTSSSGNYYLRSIPSSTVVNASFRNASFGGTAGGLIVLNNNGTTVVSVGNVTIAPSTTTNTGGGFTGTSSTTGTLYVSGNISTTSTATTQPILANTGTNTLVLNGSSSQTLTLGSTASILSGVTLQVNNTNGLILGDGTTKTFTIGASGIIDIKLGNITPTATSTLAYASGNTLRYSGSSAQTTGGEFLTTLPSAVALNINNAYGVSLNADKTVAGTISFTLGNLNTTSAFKLISSNTITASQVTGWINGKLQKSIANSSSALFAVGSSSYNPVTVSNNSGATDVFSVNVLDEVYSAGTSGTIMSAPRVKRTWDITKTNANGGTGVSFVFNWNNGETSGTITAPALYHFENSSWVKQTGTTSSTSNSLTYTGYTGTFSPFSIGDNLVTLPVTISSFSAARNGKVNKIQWSTSSEENNNGFEVQRSIDGVNYFSLGFIRSLSANGNSTSKLDYDFIDVDPIGLKQFYRLKQIDFDGKSRFSGVAVVATSGLTQLRVNRIYPNPTNSFINLNVTSSEPETIQLFVSDMSGKLIATKYHRIEIGNNNIEYNASSLNSGVYLVSIKGSNGLLYVGKFVRE
jgi:hypothetical protein